MVPSTIPCRAGTEPGMLVRSTTSKPATCSAMVAILPRISCSVKFLEPTTISLPAAPSSGWMPAARRRGCTGWPPAGRTPAARRQATAAPATAQGQDPRPHGHSPRGRATCSTTRPSQSTARGQQRHQDRPADQQRVQAEVDAGDEEDAQAPAVDEGGQRGGADQQHQRGAHAGEQDGDGEGQLHPEQDGERAHPHPAAGLHQPGVDALDADQGVAQHRQRRVQHQGSTAVPNPKPSQVASSTNRPIAGAA
jgi:hypothetical protein